MKKLAAVLWVAVNLWLPDFSFGQWSVLWTAPAWSDDSPIYFINPYIGFYAANHASIWRTSDGGKNWSRVNTPSVNSFRIFAISFADQLNGMAVGSGGSGYPWYGRILKTTDGGYNWFISYSAEYEIYKDISYVDSNTAYVAGEGGKILKTTDGGVNWIYLASGITTSLYAIDFIGVNRGFCTGNSGILKTTDGGNNWTLINTTPLQDVSFSSENNGYAVGHGGKILHTTDGGEVWTYQNSNTNNSFYGVFCWNDNICTAVGTAGTIRRTTDGGLNWATQYTGISNTLWNVFFTGKDTGYISGTDEIVLVTYNGGGSSSYHDIIQKDSIYYLSANNGIYKFYSHETSGEFNLTSFVPRNLPQFSYLSINDTHLFVAAGDTVWCYLNDDPWGLEYECKLSLNYIWAVSGFGPYFFVRHGQSFSLYKIIDGNVILVEYNLFQYPPDDYYVVFTYPYILIGKDIYKYSENAGMTYITSIALGQHNYGIYRNKLLKYSFYQEGPPTFTKHSNLHEWIIEEPDFPYTLHANWGLNLTQLHNFNRGVMDVSKNLILMRWENVIAKHNSVFVYQASSFDKPRITDYYIFLIGGDTLKYARWDQGSVYYPLVWNNLAGLYDNKQQDHSFSLMQNYPNPFNPTTVIRYTIPAVTERKVTLSIYDILGNEIVNLVNEIKLPGEYSIQWDASAYSSGVYFYRLTAGELTSTKKLLLMK